MMAMPDRERLMASPPGGYPASRPDRETYGITTLVRKLMDSQTPPVAGLLLLGALLVILGCAQGAGEPSVSVSDSAGIPLYSLDRVPSWDDPEFRWSLLLDRSIPTAAQDPGGKPLLYQPQGYARLDDGTLVVLDGSSLRIAILSPEPDEGIRRFGPSGRGPGEIWSSNSTIWPAGPQSFWVLDPGNQRLSRFNTSGDLEEERLVRIPGMAGMVFQDPVQHAPWLWKTFFESLEERALTDSIGRLDAQRREVAYIAPMPPRVEQRRRSVPTEALDIFTPMGWIAPLGPAGVVTGRNDGGRFRWYSGDGALVALIDIPMSRAPIAESEKPGLLEAFYGVARSGPNSGGRTVGDLYRLYDLMWGVGDSLFALQQSRLSTPKGERRIPENQTVWRIFTSRGRYVGAVVFPEGTAQPYWIEKGRVIASHRDEFGVVTIQEFRMSRPERQNRPDS